MSPIVRSGTAKIASSQVEIFTGILGQPQLQIGLAVCLMAILSGCGPSSSSLTKPASDKTVEETSETDLKIVTGEVVELRGLTGEAAEIADSEFWRDRLKIYVGETPSPDQPAVLGTYRVDEGIVTFKPAYDFEPGQTYLVRMRDVVGTKEINHTFQISADSPSAETSITNVFPTATVLPQNLLKFYVQFSAPMRRGDAYRHLRLLDAEGREIPNPFLELGEELWDATESRFTLLFDPGRIKKGLKPREDVGPPLEPGGHYTLVIDSDWLDRQGRPLAEEYRKEFDVVDPDETQPAIDRWVVEAPQAGTRDPLFVRFDEPMDRALLERLYVSTESGDEAVGEITVDDQEMVWRLVPDAPWETGTVTLVIDSRIEDMAGNSLHRPFEVDLSQDSEAKSPPETLFLSVEIAAPPDKSP